MRNVDYSRRRTQYARVPHIVIFLVPFAHDETSSPEELSTTVDGIGRFDRNIIIKNPGDNFTRQRIPRVLEFPPKFNAVVRFYESRVR